MSEVPLHTLRRTPCNQNPNTETPASERRGDNLKGLEDFCLHATVVCVPRSEATASLCRICAAFGNAKGWFHNAGRGGVRQGLPGAPIRPSYLRLIDSCIIQLTAQGPQGPART